MKVRKLIDSTSVDFSEGAVNGALHAYIHERLMEFTVNLWWVARQIFLGAGNRFGYTGITEGVAGIAAGS